jgi:cell division protein FtsA
MDGIKYPDSLVFGLDIGTRSIVGTVGYKDRQGRFRVIAQVVREHDTRAMLDGQIHDIARVSEGIGAVRRELEQMIDRPLTDVCIAAAGRVLKTVTVSVDYEFSEETTVTDEHIYSLNMIGVEKAYEILREETKNEETSYYCVGYSVIKYFLNGYTITNLEGHKANKISTELLATFLPDEVVEGLYRAVERAGLYVANLTLEPIAAINVAIPEKFRLLNIALVDVGAGTSDICITKDGAIVAYGMIPFAGDEMTEAVAKEYLTEFSVAEKIKRSGLKKQIVYKDIMGLSYKVDGKEVVAKLKSTMDHITKNIASKIKELNGGKTVSAVFVVGGGGKVAGFTDSLAGYLNIPKERVALRGEEVLSQVDFVQDKIKKDSLLVTPIGICLNYYEQKNNFIFVTVNRERVKLYDNDHLTIVDAAMQMGIQNELLFPRRGQALEFFVDGKQRMVRGEQGEAAIVTLNGHGASLGSEIQANDQIEITFSTVGADAVYEIGQLPEYKGTIAFTFNGKNVICPKFVKVGDELVSEYYSVQNGDRIEILNYYTLKQVLEFMDLPLDGEYYVNNFLADLGEEVYENFTISSELSEEVLTGAEKAIEEKRPEPKEIPVTVNGTFLTLKNKPSYLLVDVLDFYEFDMTPAKNSELVRKINGLPAEFVTPVEAGAQIELYWKEEGKEE